MAGSVCLICAFPSQCLVIYHSVEEVDIPHFDLRLVFVVILSDRC
jgi:hypothetical protein